MASALPIPIASTSKAPAAHGTLAASAHAASSLLGSLTRFSLGMSPSMKIALASSIEQEHGSLIGAIRGQDVGLSGEMCRDYTCCGLPLKDLHALVEHFEEAHVVVLDPTEPASATAAPSFSAGGFDLADDMELDEPVASTSATPTPTTPTVPFSSPSVLVHRGTGWTPSVPVGFAPYPAPQSALRRFRDYSTDAADCVVPELLFSPSATPSPAGSRDASPDPIDRHHHHSSSSDDEDTATAVPSSRMFLTRGAAIHASDLPPPRPKPFRCPKPGCSKAYKQANGLKYHLTHGQCNFAPLDPNSDELKPYICQAGCGKRFKNMSGLRYHYLHSNHGQHGLELLDAGKHP